MKFVARVGTAGLAALAVAVPARAWWTGGHNLVAQAAVASLPNDVPQWFRDGAGQVGHCAEDPDIIKLRETPALRDTEEPEHYLDYELLQGATLPPNRRLYLRMLAEKKLDPSKVGTVPYVVVEWTQRLAAGFMESRKWPDNPYIHTKCLVYAGILSHYTGDIAQPLHVTVHYDGRVGADGMSPRSGIHGRMDSILEKAKLTVPLLSKDQKIEPAEDILDAAVAEIQQSRSQIDRVYQLEQELPPAKGEWTPTPAAMELARERGREATRFTAAMMLTAWRKSADIAVPAYLEREAAPTK